MPSTWFPAIKWLLLVAALAANAAMFAWVRPSTWHDLLSPLGLSACMLSAASAAAWWIAAGQSKAMRLDESAEQPEPGDRFKRLAAFVVLVAVAFGSFVLCFWIAG